MRVAGKLTDKDWKELACNLKPEENQNWGNAFHFFEERIRTRYLEPILTILDMEKYEGEGFAIVNLQCSLIETIESFINGWIYNQKENEDKGLVKNSWYKNTLHKDNRIGSVNSAEIFISFFKKRLPFIKMNINGLLFYQEVRCPLLHETQTKSNWRIKKCSSATESYCESPTSKIIYRDQFQRDLEVVIKNYKECLIERKNLGEIKKHELRQNFKAKFNHLCK
ncbi:MAG: hypothetical protein JJE55_12560 [Flavobacteriaceae bacterium]|nr:hypothetical protein [Flavobacteriaceae bacterium]